MNPRLIEIQQQIDTLKAEAERLRHEEIEGVVARIKEAIVAYGLTAADLGLKTAGKPGRKPGPKPGMKTAAPAAGKRAGRKPGKASAKSNGMVRYRDANGNSWVGRGKRPQWLRDALASGKTLKDFLV